MHPSLTHFSTLLLLLPFTASLPHAGNIHIPSGIVQSAESKVLNALHLGKHTPTHSSTSTATTHANFFDGLSPFDEPETHTPTHAASTPSCSAFEAHYDEVAGCVLYTQAENKSPVPATPTSHVSTTEVSSTPVPTTAASSTVAASSTALEAVNQPAPSTTPAPVLPTAHPDANGGCIPGVGCVTMGNYETMMPANAGGGIGSPN